MSADGELPEDEALAAELALGLLDGADRAAALRRVLADRGFAKDVADWRDRLAPLFDLVPDANPSTYLWARIDAALDTAAMPAPARIGVWKGATMAALAAAAALAGVLVLRPDPTPRVIVREAPVVARLAAPLVTPDTPSMVLASYDPSHAMLRVDTSTLPEDARTPELWVVPDGGAPHSLGLIGRSGTTELTMSAELKAWLVDGATLAVSLEPAGGSPTGQPTGPIVASGKLTPV